MMRLLVATIAALFAAGCGSGDQVAAVPPSTPAATPEPSLVVDQALVGEWKGETITSVYGYATAGATIYVDGRQTKAGSDGSWQVRARYDAERAMIRVKSTAPGETEQSATIEQPIDEAAEDAEYEALSAEIDREAKARRTREVAAARAKANRYRDGKACAFATDADLDVLRDHLTRVATVSKGRKLRVDGLTYLVAKYGDSFIAVSYGPGYSNLSTVGGTESALDTPRADMAIVPTKLMDCFAKAAPEL